MLEARAIHKLWGKNDPFYSLYDIGSYTFAPYKVAWPYISGKISGKGAFSVCVIESTADNNLGVRTPIADHRVMQIPVFDVTEAHYIASILNSSITQLIVSSYTIETAISTHVLENVRIPEFNPSEPTHFKLSELSKTAHSLAKQYHENSDSTAVKQLKEVEERIDVIVAALYEIDEAELNEIKTTLTILKPDLQS